VVGPNASGKTNLLEAVLVLARGNSFRVRDMELLQIGKDWARLDGFFDNNSRTVKFQAGEKTYEIDDKLFKRLSLERTVPIVFFEPNHLQLLSRGPEGRRDYFDELLERSQLDFKSLAGNYRRTLAQRNALLKHGQRSATQQLFAWNIRLSELGSQIASARQELVDRINQSLSKTYSQIATHNYQAELKYDSQFPVENYGSRLLSRLESNAQREFERGFTLYGPHREDFLFYLNDQLVSQTASRGESRSLLLTLKIFELKLIEATRDQKPIFLLDDVFSELDSARRQALVKHLKNYQTVITTTDADAVIEYFAGSHNLIPLSGHRTK
jgi:DNA replication and repair protein RecF